MYLNLSIDSIGKIMPNSLKSLINILLITLVFLFICKDALANEPVNEFEQAMKKHEGKVVYLDFWASWCVPCRKSFPWMNTLQEKHQAKGFIVLSVNLDSQASLAEKFLQQTPANFAIIYDAKGALAKRFKLKGMPSSYLFNREGKLMSSHVGFNAEKQKKYEHEISQALIQ